MKTVFKNISQGNNYDINGWGGGGVASFVLPQKLHDSGQYSFMSRLLQESLSFATIEAHSGRISAQPENVKITVWIKGENEKNVPHRLMSANFFKSSTKGKNSVNNY